MTTPIRTDHRHDDNNALYFCVILLAFMIVAVILLSGYEVAALKARVAAIEAKEVTK